METTHAATLSLIIVKNFQSKCNQNLVILIWSSELALFYFKNRKIYFITIFYKIILHSRNTFKFILTLNFEPEFFVLINSYFITYQIFILIVISRIVSTWHIGFTPSLVGQVSQIPDNIKTCFQKTGWQGCANTPKIIFQLSEI